MRLSKIIAALFTLSMSIGCAFISRGPEQQLLINAFEAKTNNVLPADCIVSNDEGIVYTKSNESVIVRRDKDPLTVDCFTDMLSGQSIVAGKINDDFWAIDFFMIDYCIVSCLFDAASGSWAEYPSMIDISLALKDEDHFKRLELRASELNVKIEEYNKKVANLIEQSDNYNDYGKNRKNRINRINEKIEDSQNTLNKINTELSLRSTN